MHACIMGPKHHIHRRFSKDPKNFAAPRVIE
jgi:hypothetical protein